MNEMNTLMVKTYASPCGVLALGSSGDRLCMCDWLDAAARHSRIVRRLERLLRAGFTEGASAVVERAIAQLDEYFAGRRCEFDVPLLLEGTEFQKRVWTELLAIPYGSTISYGDMAQIIGTPSAVRAVANANGANALSVFIPCHRVVGSNGTLTGYGGGLAAKQFLLQLERRHLMPGAH